MTNHEICNESCLVTIRRIQESGRRFDLVFADPPFNIGWKYDQHKDTMSKEEYANFTQSWVRGSGSILTGNGSMFVVIGDNYVAEMKLALDATGMYMRNWIVWNYSFGVACQNKFSRSHCHILYYTKHPKRFTFNADAVRVPSKRQLLYADRRANPKGKVPDDTWDFSRVCGTFKERTGHPCQLPEALLERVILAASSPGDTVYDPFGGSFTTAAVARRLGRNSVTSEVSAAYCEAGRARIESTQEALT